MNDARPLLAILAALPGVLVLAFPKRKGLRTALAAAAALLPGAAALFLVPEILSGLSPEWRAGLGGNLSFVLRADSLALLFTLAASLCAAACALAQSASPHGKSSAGSDQALHALCLAAAAGAAFAGNIFTQFLFLETLALCLYLCLRKKDKQAARTFALHALLAALCLAAAAAWAPKSDFLAGGFLAADGALTRILFALFVLGLAMKAALFPLGRWLNGAAAAAVWPSALLVASAAAAFLRLCGFAFGPTALRSLGVDGALAALAAAALLISAALALSEINLKKRSGHFLAAQAALVLMGAAWGSPAALAGAALQIPVLLLCFLTLFFCADSLSRHAQAEHVQEIAGLGRRMPATMTAFATAACAGLPGAAGFVAFWNLGLGAAHSGHEIFLIVLGLGALLSFAALAPLARAAFFSGEEGALRFAEGPWALWLPACLLAALSLLLGFCPDAVFSLYSLAWDMADSVASIRSAM